MNAIKATLLTIAVLILAGIGFVYAGLFNVAADEPHWNLTRRVIEVTRERSIAVRASGIQAPSLEDTHLIAMGAEHYEEMCTQCHLAPGRKDSELRSGMNPTPPNLAEHARHRSPEQMFWIIKHGLKMTAMPAWGITHDDRSIWAMVAFVRKLPDLSPAGYRELVAQGGEHSSGAEADGTESRAGEASGHEHSHQGNSKTGASVPDHGEDVAGAPTHQAVPAAAARGGTASPSSATEPVSGFA